MAFDCIVNRPKGTKRKDYNFGFLQSAENCE